MVIKIHTSNKMEIESIINLSVFNTLNINQNNSDIEELFKIRDGENIIIMEDINAHHDLWANNRNTRSGNETRTY